MKLVFWTKVPFTLPIRNAFKTALKSGFLNLSRNKSLVTEFSKYLFDLQIYIRTASKELHVNLRGGVIVRRREFRRKLNSQQALLGAGSTSIDVAGIILRMLSTESKLQGNIGCLKDLLIEGTPVIIIANHPFAPIDGLLLMNLIHQYRCDYFQLVNGNNGLVSICPEFNYRLIPVDLSEGALRTSDPVKARTSRTKAFRQSFNKLYDSGQCLIMFPSGNISKALKWGEPIQDSKWLSGVGLLVKLFSESPKELLILPVFIDTHMGSQQKSHNYQFAFLENPTDVSAALMEAFFYPPKQISLHIGEVLKSSNFKGKTKIEITEELRSSVYKMCEQLPIANKTL